MSSNEESDDEFQSADEDIDFEPHSKQRLELESKHLEDFEAKNDNEKQISDQQLNLTSVKDKELESIVSAEKSRPTTEIRNQRPDEKAKVDIKSEDNKIDRNTKQTFDETVIQKSNETKCKTVIKGRKILRKADRIREQTNTEELKNTDDREDNDFESVISVDEKEKTQKFPETKIEASNQILDSEKEKVDIKTEDKKTYIKTDDINTQIKTEDMKTEVQISETFVEKNEENETKEEKTVIKGRKLLRKADRFREQINTEDSEISEEKKIEVLNKLSDLSERDDSSSKWNNWFTDIKSAAMTATSTTVSHVSQASNKWSLNPKSLLTSAVSITSNVGSGISSVVENVSSVMDSAIGAPPPEQMASIVNKDSVVHKSPESDKQSTRIDENESKSSLGFGLFDYTLNTLGSIGKKTLEVIVVDDKHNRDIKTDKKD